MGLPQLTALEELVRQAGSLAMSHRGRVTAEEKPDRTLVSEADREVEGFLVKALSSLFPEAAVLAEEGSVRAGAGRYHVVLDPIDGTSAFLAGLPTWCVSLGVLEAGQAVAGVVYVPCSGEMYSAAGGSAWLNGRRLPILAGRVRAAEPYILVPAKLHLRRHLRYPGKARALGSAAHHLALVARGSAEAALLEPAYLWDLAGAAALLAAVDGSLRYASGSAIDLGALLDGRRAPDDIVAAPSDRIQDFLDLLGASA